MRIEDLTYLDKFSDEGNIVGGFASVDISVFTSAIGAFTSTAANSQSWAVSSPYGGSLAVGYGQVFAIAYTPPSFPKFRN
ncbi:MULTISPECIES: hypothetical protein [unclassified Microcoleus]|uniref:hypothetical protein n=1 Tax=unclassified Microcoleus TaxID=2642155 RepID=UPI002FD5F432